MPGKCRLFIGMVCCYAAALGCSHTRDISAQPPYSKWIGTADRLTGNCELWKEAGSYEILTHAYPPVDVDNRDYAKLPKGTAVKVEAIKRETKLFFLAAPLMRPYDYAIVSLSDPKSPDHHIHATVDFDYLVTLGRLKKQAADASADRP